MRGADGYTETMFTLARLDDFVPARAGPDAAGASADAPSSCSAGIQAANGG